MRHLKPPGYYVAISRWLLVVLGSLIGCLELLTPPIATAQTLIAEEAYHERFCGGRWIFRDCRTVSTRRISRNFVQQQLGSEILGSLWGASAHCLTVSYPSERCAQSVAVFSDPTWNRIVWGQASRFLKSYGTAGSGAGQFEQPAGVAVTRADGEWHVAFVADPIAGRVAVLALGYNCRCVLWLGLINAAETGTPLRGPFDVAWDPAATWTLDDDRVFILDSGNDRVVVYRVGLYPAAGTMTQQYVGAFGTTGSGSAQFKDPQGIDVRTWNCGSGVICGDVYIADTGNRRVMHWWYDTPNSSTPDDTPWVAGESAHDPNARFIGITHDHYGDVYVSDYAQNRIIKLRGSSFGTDLEELKRYGGGSSSWYNGNFVWPTSLEVTRSFRPYNSSQIVEEGLPFVSSLEKWGDTTGLQTHRLGVDVDNLTAQASADGNNIYGRFVFTATGLYSWTIYTPNGAPAASSGGNVASRSGWVYPSANISGYGAGTYTLTVQYQSGYMYDDGQWKTKSVSITAGSGNPCDTNPWLPECNPCPPPQIYCSLQALSAVPTVYSLSQDQAIPADAPNLDAYRTGLRRVESIGALRLSGTGVASTRSTTEDARVNGITGVRFGVPRPGSMPASANQQRRTGAQERVRVQILIYDAGGRLVRTAVSEDLDPGFYQYQWDVRNDRGERVAPGVYVLVMNAPGFAKNSKLIVTR